MSRKQTLRLKTRARLLAERDDSTIPMASVSSLKDGLRQLYERLSFTVREIAQLAGISERMLYKYAEQGRWADRETRVSRKMTLLDPAHAKQIAARAAQTVRLSEEAASKEIARIKAHRTEFQGGRAFEQNLRIYELLAGALAELSRGTVAHERSRDLSRDLQLLVLRQMQIAFESAVTPPTSSVLLRCENANKNQRKSPVLSCRRQESGS